MWLHDIRGGWRLASPWLAPTHLCYVLNPNLLAGNPAAHEHVIYSFGSWKLWVSTLSTIQCLVSRRDLCSAVPKTGYVSTQLLQCTELQKSNGESRKRAS